MKTFKFRFFAFFFFGFLITACQSETLIVGQILDTDDDFKMLVGKTVYIYPEAEIKTFLDEKKTRVDEIYKKQIALRLDCDKLKAKIPPFDAMNPSASNKAKELSSACETEYENGQKILYQTYFENLPESRFSAKIEADGIFERRVPAEGFYVVFVPNRTVFWVNAVGGRKFIIIDSRVDLNGEVVH